MTWQSGVISDRFMEYSPPPRVYEKGGINGGCFVKPTRPVFSESRDDCHRLAMCIYVYRYSNKFRVCAPVEIGNPNFYSGT